MNINILIVDDSPILRKAIKKVALLVDVEEAGISEAGNGKEALERLESNWVDLVLLDINMPVMNGMQFMQELRSRPEYKDLAVVVVSTDANEDHRAILLGLGVLEFLHKPFAPEGLHRILQKIRGQAA